MATLAIKQRLLIKQIKKTGISKEKLINLFEKIDESEDQGELDLEENFSLHRILDQHEKEFQKVNTVKQVALTSRIFKEAPNEDITKLPSDKQTLERVQEFMKKNEHAIWTEIKDFVNKHNIVR